MNISQYKEKIQEPSLQEVDEDRKFRDLEKKVQTYIDTPYKPVYRDEMEEELVALQAQAQQDIFHELKHKLKYYEMKPKMKMSKNPLNLKTVIQDSISDAMSDIDSKRASIDGLSDLYVEKPEKDMSEQCKIIEYL